MFERTARSAYLSLEATFTVLRDVPSHSVKCGDVGSGAAGQDGVELETAPPRGREDSSGCVRAVTMETPSAERGPHLLFMMQEEIKITRCRMKRTEEVCRF